MDSDRLQRLRSRAIFGASVGTFVEFFDYASYSFLSTTIASVFFPVSGVTIALVQTWALFALSFFMRPVGALVWGHYGDHIGRTKILAITIFGIGIATCAIGSLPGYRSIGLAAPLLLVLFRLFQSFCTAGEYTGAAVMVGEFAPRSLRGRYISAVPISCALGFLAAAGLASVLRGLLTDDEMLSWGWRVPFFAGGVLTVSGWYVRQKLPETPEFTTLLSERGVTNAPVRWVLRRHGFLLLRLLCVMGVNAAGYYLVLGYAATYLQVELGFRAVEATWITTLGLLVYLPLVYSFAVLSDRISRRSILLASSLLFIALSYPAFKVLTTGGFYTALLTQFALVAILSLNDATFATYFVESFPAAIRFSGFALAFNVGVAVFGGSAPLVATWLIQTTRNKLMPAWMMTAVAVLSVPALLRPINESPAEVSERANSALPSCR